MKVISISFLWCQTEYSNDIFSSGEQQQQQQPTTTKQMHWVLITKISNGVHPRGSCKEITWYQIKRLNLLKSKFTWNDKFHLSAQSHYQEQHRSPSPPATSGSTACQAAFLEPAEPNQSDFTLTLLQWQLAAQTFLWLFWSNSSWVTE